MTVWGEELVAGSTGIEIRRVTLGGGLQTQLGSGIGGGISSTAWNIGRRLLDGALLIRGLWWGEAVGSPGREHWDGKGDGRSGHKVGSQEGTGLGRAGLGNGAAGGLKEWAQFRARPTFLGESSSSPYWLFGVAAA